MDENFNNLGWRLQDKSLKNFSIYFLAEFKELGDGSKVDEI